MKKLIALILTFALIFSIIPTGVFAVEGEPDYYIKDTFVYDFMRGEDGIFEDFVLQFVEILENGESYTWMPGNFPSNSSSSTNLGDVTLSDTQHTERWEVGNTYPVSYGNGQTFNVEVLETPIERIELNDVSFCVYNSDDGRYEYRPTCTIYYKNGDEEISDGFGIEYFGHYDFCHFDVELADSQETTPWQLGGSYEVTGTLMGCTDTFTVNVICAEEISVAPIYMLEGSGWMTESWDPETESYVEWMNYSFFPDDITITLSDGTYLTGSPYDMDRSVEYFLGWSAEQSYENQWGVGEHTATIRLGELFADYQVIIQENPVESVDIHNISIVEKSFGWMEGDIFFYDVAPVATITLKDGTVIEDSYVDFGEDRYWIEWDSSIQYSDPWTVGNSYTITGSLLGISDTFTVTITESPIESIQIEDVSVMCYTDGWDNGVFFYYEPQINATITLKDGTVLHRNYLELENTAFNVAVDWDVQYEEHWTVGNTYTVTGSLLGASDTFRVTVTAGPVASIEFEDISIIEYTNGYMEGDFWYYRIDPLATITLKDGTVITGYNIELGDNTYWIDVDTSSQYAEPWAAGNTYTVTGSLMGVSNTFKVTVLEGPVESLEIEDMTVIEGSGDYEGNGKWYYGIREINATVTLKDGTVLTMEDSSGVKIGEDWYYIEVDGDSQYEDRWTAGNTYTVTGSLLGVSDTFNVTVLPTPVESLSFADVVLYQGIDSYSYGDFDEYNFSLTLTDVELKDGTEPEFDSGGIYYADDYYWVLHNGWEVQSEEYWTPGNTYQVTGYLLGVEAKVNVTVQENPIQSIELVKRPDQREVLVGVYPNLKGATVRINYTDGTYEDVTFSDDFTAGYERTFYSKKLGRRTNITGVSAFETAGQKTADLELFGLTCQIPFTVKENKIQKLILTENADKSITVSVLNSDNTGFDMKIRDLCFVYWADTNAYYAGFFTDKGLFEGIVYTDGSFLQIELFAGQDRRIVSNTISSECEWFAVMCYMQDHPLYYIADIEDAPKTYSGVITADNIDAIIEIAGNIYGSDYTAEGEADENGNYYRMFPGALVREAVETVFAVENVDLSLSEYYDPSTDTYKHYDYILGAGEVRTVTPDQVSYKNGTWTISSSVQDYDGKLQVLQMSLNSNFQLKSYSIDDGSLFRDVPITSWQYTAAEYALERNLMAGKGTDEYGRVKFDPNSPITREEFVQVLYNAEGKPAYENDKVFPDVKDAWYKSAVLWANSMNIANGLGDGSFGIGKNITRQDLALMLYKYAALKGLDLSAEAGRIDAYADGDKVSGYAKTAMNWAVTKGVLSGKGTAGKPLSTFKLDPAGTATRAECAAMLKNFMTAFGL